MSFRPPSSDNSPRRAFVFCVTVLCKVTQAFESGGPILLVLRDPRRQFNDQRIRVKLIDLLSALSRCEYQTRCPQTHQVLGDARLHQVGELGGELTDRQRTAFGQQIKNLPARGVG